MQAKRQVVARFPDAHLYESVPGHWVIMTGDGSVRYMDIHRENVWQGKTAAWRSAYFWCYRNPHAKPWTVEEMDAEIRKGPAPR